MQDILKAVGKWLALVVVLVAVLLGAALGFMYTQVNVGDLPAYAVTFGGCLCYTYVKEKIKERLQHANGRTNQDRA